MSRLNYYACCNCYHAMAESQVADQLHDICPKCSVGTMKSLEAMRIPPPAVGANLDCLVCAYVKPWGIFDSATGVAVCVDCRDAARASKEKSWPGDHPMSTIMERAKRSL